MRIVLTEDQIARIKLKIAKEGLNEDELDDLIAKGSNLINKGIEAGKQFISGLETDVEKKAVDEPTKADFIGDDVDDFFKILKGIDSDISEQKLGTMTRQQAVEAVQIGLQILGYALPRFGTDGLFGPETAAAVNKYKRDKNIVDFDDTADNTTNDLNEAALMPPLPIESGKTYRWDEKRSSGAHKGIDIPAKNGTPIKSIADGKVIAAGSLDSRCGDGVSVSHADGFVSSYCHLSNVGVKTGDVIKQGDIIGLSGGVVGAPGSGNSQGPHLHLTLKKDGNRVNPLEYFGTSIGGYYDTKGSANVIGGATITVSMVKTLIDNLLDKGVTSDDLKKHVDPAVSSGGSADFTDLDLLTNEGKRAYRDISDNFIRQRDPNAVVSGDMLANSAERAYRQYRKYVPPELALAQLTLEGGIGSSSNSRPRRTNNPFNVGNTETGSKTFPTVEAGVDAYYDLLARRYLVRGKTASDLVNDFKNEDGNNYATAGTYEVGLKNLISSIRKRNQSVYASLSQTKTETLNESLLLEADKRQAIINAFGFSEDWVNEFHGLNKKLSIWIADTFVKFIIDQVEKGQNREIVRQGDDDDLKESIISQLNEKTPEGFVQWNQGIKPMYQYIMHWVSAPRREQLNIRDLTFQMAYDQAEEWHESLEVRKDTDYKETGDVFIDYRNADGVGYYWVNLHKSYCSDEQARMGHCGRASNNGELISFRRVNAFGEGESLMTLDYRRGGIVGDFHRHGNKKPTSRFHNQIIDLLTNTTFPVTSLTREGVHRYEDNFQLADLSPADLKRVYDNNPALKYNINDESAWPGIIDAVIGGELNFTQYPNNVKLKLLNKSIELNNQTELLTKFTDDVVINIINNAESLNTGEKSTFASFFGAKSNDLLKSDFDLFYDSSSISQSKMAFIETLRSISQNFFSIYTTFCDYIDHGFKKFDEDTVIAIIGSRGIKRSLFSCTESVPFLSRFVENSPVDKNGNIIVKTEDGLWGLLKRTGETILHPQFYAVGVSPENKQTYTVQNANQDWFRFDPATGETLKLAKKR